MSTSKENNFSLIHLLAACMVVFGHMFALAEERAPAILGISVHVMGVYILFVVSGFLVCKSCLRSKSPFKFYAKHLLRIYPPLIVCLVLTVIIMRRVSVADLSDYIAGAWLYLKCNLLMKPYYILPGAFHENPYKSINGSLWTLPVELMCFFVLPIYLTTMKRFRNHDWKLSFLISTALTLTVIILQSLTPKLRFVVWGTDWADSLRVISFFFMGVSYGLLPEDTAKKYCRPEISIFLLCMTLCLGSHLPSWIPWFFVPYIVVSLGISRTSILRNFCNHHDYAYGIFLWGYPIQQLVMYAYIHLHLNFSLSPIALFAIAFPMIWIMGYLQEKFVEAPISKLSKKL